MTHDSETFRVVIIGGGVSGLCTAGLLAESHGDGILLLEAGAEVGGTAQTELCDGYTCDIGPNGFLDREPLTLEWVKRLGLDGELVRANAQAARRFVYRGGKLHELKPPPAFFFGGPLSLPGRLRLVFEPLISARMDKTPESIWNFAERRIGGEAADILVSSMVSGIYGGDAKQLSLEHCFPRMAAMERDYGSLFAAMRAKKKDSGKGSPMGPGGVLTSFRGGVGGLAAAASAQPGVSIRKNSAVSAIQKQGEGYAVQLREGGVILAGAVVVATPSFVAAEILRDLDAELATALEAIPYAGISVLCTGYKRDQIRHDLNGFGFLAPRTEGMRALGCIWTSSIFPNQAPEGSVLLRTMFGGATDPEAQDLSDAELLDTFLCDLDPVLGISGKPELLKIFRWRRGIPQYDLQHGERLAVIEAAATRHPGLVLAGNAYHGVGLNDCVLSAHRAVATLAAATKI